MRIVIKKDVKIPMRDGVVLAADLYQPPTETPLPTLIQRTPYSKDLSTVVNAQIDSVRAAQAGYTVLVQDTRGRFASEGMFRPFEHEAEDGADTVAWAAGQPWSSGQIGMVGASYIGATQWLAAMQEPAPLGAIAPQFTAADYYEGWTYQGGAFQLGFALSWALLYLAPGDAPRMHDDSVATAAEVELLGQASDHIAELYNHLPVADIPLLVTRAPYYLTWLQHATYDAYWAPLAPRGQYERVHVPALNVGGWYDLFLGGTLDNYRGMRERGGSNLARSQQKLIIGPWAHGMTFGTFPDRSYGHASALDAIDPTGVQLRWFDRWLKGIDNGIEREPPVKLFVMGANVWRDETGWPLPDTRLQPYYLHSGGRANGLRGDGSLSAEPPGDEPEDVYIYDPRNPVPTFGGATYLPGVLVAANAGPRDQRPVESRHDVLCYTTEPLSRPIEITGPIELVLFASSSASDTDFTGKLVDVWPDGRAEILTDGILRARHRQSLSGPIPLEPGRTYELHIDMIATANVFAPGHRIRLEVSSSNFPRFDRNTNTGGSIAEESLSEVKRAVNCVHHDSLHPSHLVLPLVERE